MPNPYTRTQAKAALAAIEAKVRQFFTNLEGVESEGEWGDDAEELIDTLLEVLSLTNDAKDIAAKS